MKMWSVSLLVIFSFMSVSCDKTVEVMKKKQSSAKAKSEQNLANLKLLTVYGAMMLDEMDFGKYRKVAFDKHLEKEAEMNKDLKPVYSYHIKHEKCPDCGIQDSGYKIALVGNIDDDATLDVWTIDQNKKITHIQDDVSL